MALDIQRIKKSIRVIIKFIKKDARRPSVDAIHDLRTNSRRLEATLKTLGSNSKGEEKSLLKDLARVRKGAGKVRDMDILTLHALTTNHRGEQNCMVELLEYLGAKRDRHAKRERAVVEELEPRLRRELKHISKETEKLFEQRAKENTKSFAQKATAEIRAKAINLASDLRTPGRLDRSNLHPYRLKLKKLLYILQLSNQASDRDFAEKVGEANDAIGEWHDWEELSAIATELLDHGQECKFLQRLKNTSNSKYRRALFIVHQLRKRYVEPRQRGLRGNHAAGTATSSMPLLRTTSEIAHP